MNCSYFVIVHGIFVLYFTDPFLVCCHAKRACEAAACMWSAWSLGNAPLTFLLQTLLMLILKVGLVQTAGPSSLVSCGQQLHKKCDKSAMHMYL